MNTQTIINLFGGACLAVFGWLGRELWDAAQKLREDLHQIESELPKIYVMKVDLDRRMDHIEQMFQRIYDKLDGKADK